VSSPRTSPCTEILLPYILLMFYFCQVLICLRVVKIACGHASSSFASLHVAMHDIVSVRSDVSLEPRISKASVFIDFYSLFFHPGSVPRFYGEFLVLPMYIPLDCF
jgi:hypothetical protein